MTDSILHRLVVAGDSGDLAAFDDMIWPDVIVHAPLGLSTADREAEKEMMDRAASPAITALRRAVKERFGESVTGQAVLDVLHDTAAVAEPRTSAHLASVMSEQEDDDLVERLAKLQTNGKPRRHLSFASKFAHFYIDKERFPIFDSYAIERLRFHLSGVNLPTDNPPAYAAYVSAHSALIALSELDCSGRELDRYLWVGGLYRAWSRNASVPINVEVRTLFLQSDIDETLRQDLTILRGTA